MLARSVAASTRALKASLFELKSRSDRTVAARELLRQALRLRPDRIIVGEVRGIEAWDLLQALNTGHQGSMSTIHSNSTNRTRSVGRIG